MNLQDINTQLIFTTVPIWVKTKQGETLSATAFFYQYTLEEEKSIPFLVTNAHVVNDSENAVIALLRRVNNKPSLEERLNAEIPGNILQRFKDEVNDIAVIPIGPILNQLHNKNFDVFFRSIDPSIIPTEKQIQELSAVEEITFIGYPSGIFDQKNNTPIVRKGITATPIWNDFNGEKVFLIDAGVYPGSSGSPVLIVNTGSYSADGGIKIGNRIIFLGLISRTMQRKELNNQVYLGLGHVIKSIVLKNFIEDIVEKINPK